MIAVWVKDGLIGQKLADRLRKPFCPIGLMMLRQGDYESSKLK